MSFIYSLSLKMFQLALHFAAPFMLKAKQMLAGRQRVWEQIAAADHAADYLWVHCASLGEFEQGRPIIEKYKVLFPQRKVLLTFFSPSGYEIRKNYEGADLVIYLPFDSAKNARRLLQELHICTAIFIKYEFWYHYLKVLKNKGIPTYSVSAIFRKEQAFFQWYGAWYRQLLACFTQIFVQNEISKQLLEQIGVKSIVAGDTRFDRVADIVKLAKGLPKIAQFKAEKKVVVCGSTWPKDEDLLVRFINADESDTKYIIAAHEVHESHIKAICESLKVSYVRYTQMDGAALIEAKVLIIDTIGILSSAYRYGEIAYIGGGFGVGIHNTLEAATYGMPILFGPNYHKFKEAVDLVSQQAASSIESYEELSVQLTIFLTNDEALKAASVSAENYVKDNTGATEKVLSCLK